MLTSEALAVYKTRPAMAAAAEVSVSATYQWDYNHGGRIPPLSAAVLAKRSKGRLKFDPELYLQTGWNNRKPS